MRLTARQSWMAWYMKATTRSGWYSWMRPASRWRSLRPGFFFKSSDTTLWPISFKRLAYSPLGLRLTMPATSNCFGFTSVARVKRVFSAPPWVLEVLT